MPELRRGESTIERGSFASTLRLRTRPTANGKGTAYCEYYARSSFEVRSAFPVRIGTCAQLFLENELDIDCIANRCPVWPRARSKSKSQQDIPKFSIVATIRRRIESEQFCPAFLIDIEIRDEMIAFQRRRRGERRKKKLSGSRGKIRSRATARTRSHSAPRSGSNS